MADSRRELFSFSLSPECGRESGAGEELWRCCTYLSMTTAGVWLAIVARCVQLRAATARFSARSIQLTMLDGSLGLFGVQADCGALRSKITSRQLPKRDPRCLVCQEPDAPPLALTSTTTVYGGRNPDLRKVPLNEVVKAVKVTPN